MVKIKRKEKVALFKSGIGTNIKLDILVKNSVLKITVFKLVYSVTRRRVVILVICILCNVLSLLLNILNTQFITAIFIIMLLYMCRLCSTVTEESLVAIKGLGFQMTTKYMIGVKTIFIPQEQVQNIFVNEVIYRNRVIYLLSLLTKDAHVEEGKLVPLFSGTLPRLACLKVIYNHLKAIQD